MNPRIDRGNHLFCSTRRGARNFWGQGSFLKIRAKNLFFSAIKLHVDIIVGFFPWPAFWLWLWLFFIKVLLVCTTMAGARGWGGMHFSLSWSLKVEFLMLFESKYKRKWMLCNEPEFSEREDSWPTLHGGPFFQKRISHSNTKYSITNIHAARARSYNSLVINKRRPFWFLQLGELQRL